MRRTYFDLVLGHDKAEAKGKRRKIEKGWDIGEKYGNRNIRKKNEGEENMKGKNRPEKINLKSDEEEGRKQTREEEG